MTIATGLAASLIEAPEPVIEHIGVDDPKTAHGGRPRRRPSPPVPDGIAVRASQPVALETRVRRVPPGPLNP